MLWAVSKEIVDSKEELLARLQYIKDVSGDNTASWRTIRYKGKILYYWCETSEGINGAFVSGHNRSVYNFCFMREMLTAEFLVANTCIWIPGYDKKILKQLRSNGKDKQLWYAKQTSNPNAVSVGKRYIKIEDLGDFGFKTSKSERFLYRNRNKGLMRAIKCSFELVESEGEGANE